MYVTMPIYWRRQNNAFRYFDPTYATNKHVGQDMDEGIIRTNHEGIYAKRICYYLSFEVQLILAYLNIKICYKLNLTLLNQQNCGLRQSYWKQIDFQCRERRKETSTALLSSVTRLWYEKDLSGEATQNLTLKVILLSHAILCDLPLKVNICFSQWLTAPYIHNLKIYVDDRSFWKTPPVGPGLAQQPYQAYGLTESSVWPIIFGQ